MVSLVGFVKQSFLKFCCVGCHSISSPKKADATIVPEPIKMSPKTLAERVFFISFCLLKLELSWMYFGALQEQNRRMIVAKNPYFKSGFIRPDF
jgi:hypothetical protein